MPWEKFIKYHLIVFLLTLDKFTGDSWFSANLYNFLLDAIRAILVYSQSVEELLRRRKVHREVIFKYLATQGVIIPPATEKHNLIQHAKDYWKSSYNQNWRKRQSQLRQRTLDLWTGKTDFIVIILNHSLCKNL